MTFFKKIAKYGWADFKRHKSVSLSAVAVMTLMLSLVVSLFLFQHGFNVLVQRAQDKMDISVYFKSEAGEEDILKAKDEVASIAQVERVDYVSKADALNSFTQTHKDDRKLMASLTELGFNPLLASLSIRAKEASEYGQIALSLEKSSFNDKIEKIDYTQRKPLIDKVFSTASTLNRIILAVSIILAAIAASLIFNQIRLSLYHLKKEIEVMNLVGAPHWFIKGPFMAQGAIIGLFGVIITSLFFFALCFFLSPHLAFFLPGLDLFDYFVHNFLIIFAVQLLVGVGLAVASSWLAVKKYLA
ncbi:MAG: permease-like cell division protein FtsX [Patescibacteria group bacterium]